MIMITLLFMHIYMNTDSHNVNRKAKSYPLYIFEQLQNYICLVFYKIKCSFNMYTFCLFVDTCFIIY